ncbi:MAG: hypothetical protein ACOCRO_06245 [Halanaerobiales bacterium]
MEWPLSDLIKQLTSGSRVIQTRQEEGEFTDKLFEEIAEIKEILRDEEDVIGIEIEETDNDFNISRINHDEDFDFDALKMYGGRRRCTLDDDGNVTSYYDDPTYTEDGSIGQVMVEQPNYYYKYTKIPEGAIYLISENEKTGFEPMFDRGGYDYDYIYLPAYEGSVYDVSNDEYLLEDEQTVDFAEDMLSSIADAQPMSGDDQSAHIENCRQLAHNRGDGWEQWTFDAVFSEQLLFAIEFATFDWQSLSEGITNLNSGDSNHSQNTGHTSSLGNETGEVVISPLENGASGASETYAFSYRGVENFFGNRWQFIDGINIQDHVPFINNDFDFESDKFTGNYESLNIQLPTSNGYGSNLINHYSFLPKENEGSSSTYYYDYFYQNSGDRIVRLGGNWGSELRAGAFCWIVTYSSSNAIRAIGASVLYYPKN